MRETLVKLRGALELLKKASVFKKALVAEAALLVACDLFEQIVAEIESLKGSQTGADRRI